MAIESVAGGASQAPPIIGLSRCGVYYSNSHSLLELHEKFFFMLDHKTIFISVSKNGKNRFELKASAI